MNKKTVNKLHITFIVVFIILNIFNTYFQTTLTLNRYISPVERTVQGEITALLGNFSFLVLVLIIVYAIFKKDRVRFITLLTITFFLNAFIFLMNIFTMFYSTTFTRDSFQIFKNPSEGVSDGLLVESLLQLITYYRILIFLPTIVLAIIYIIYRKKSQKMTIRTKFNIQQYIISALSAVVMLIIAVFSYSSLVLNSDVQINAIAGTNGIQNFGLYPFYVGEFMGYKVNYTTKNSLKIEDENSLFDEYNSYNKNKTSYYNFIDGKMYGNSLSVSESEALISDELNLNSEDSLSGVFKDKNLMLVHLESLNHFLFDIPIINNEFEFLNKLFAESFVFENYYASVGMGVSSDAEFSVLTGLYPNGYSTFYRDYEKGDFEIDSLASLFKMKNYRSKVYHGDHKDFYNRNAAYKDLLKFTENYYSIDDFVIRDGYSSYKDYLKGRSLGIDYNGQKINSPWPSEFELFDALYEDLESFGTDKHFTLPMFLTPHTPFLFNPYETKLEDLTNYNRLKLITKRYIENAKYIDDLIKSIFFDPLTGNKRIDENTVYVFYSDHGSSIKNNDLSLLYERELNTLEERQILLKTIAFIYAPSSEIDLNTNINKGLLTGNQPRVRSNTDLYRTIGDLFGLFSEEEFYFGTHGLSKEPNYVIDNRVQDVIIDNLKDLKNPYITSLRNKKIIFPSEGINNQVYVINKISDFKKLNDLILIDDSVYKDLKRLYKDK